MTGKSTLLSLDSQILDACHEALRAGKTVSQITACLNSLGAEVSRSAVGRYLEKTREQIGEYRLAIDVSALMTPRFGEQVKGDIAVMVRELGKISALKLVTQLNAALDTEVTDENLDANSATLQRLTRAIANLSRTESINLDVREQIEDQARKRALNEAAEAMKSGAKRAGVSEENWKLIEAELKLL
jgi:hypothetical protein